MPVVVYEKYIVGLGTCIDVAMGIHIQELILYEIRGMAGKFMKFRHGDESYALQCLLYMYEIEK